MATLACEVEGIVEDTEERQWTGRDGNQNTTQMFLIRSTDTSWEQYFWFDCHKDVTPPKKGESVKVNFWVRPWTNGRNMTAVANKVTTAQVHEDAPF